MGEGKGRERGKEVAMGGGRQEGERKGGGGAKEKDLVIGSGWN